MTRDLREIEKIKSNFPKSHELLMPESQWDSRHKNLWDIGVEGWLDIMLDDKAAFGSQIDFYQEQVESTRGMFSLAMFIQSRCLYIVRDEVAEKTVFDKSWEEYFPEELYIDRVQLPETFRELVVKPASSVGRYQIAMGRIAAPEFSEEAIR